LVSRGDREQDDGGHWVASGGWPEPIESSILDQPGTLRASFCARGAEALEGYRGDHDIRFTRTGQLVVARDAGEMALLRDLAARDPSVRLLSAAEVAQHERGLECAGGLVAEDAGVIDGDALRLALRIDAETAGAYVTEGCRLVAAYPMRRGFEIDLGGLPGDLETLRCDLLINAGEDVEAVQVASRIDGMRRHLPPEPLAPGSKRYKLEGTAPFSRLVVPGCRGSKASALFFSGFQGESWMDVLASPENDSDRSAADRRMTDWRIQGQTEHGIVGLVNVFGVDARSETRASLALAEAVADTLSGRVTWSVPQPASRMVLV
jgi:hypothetical protein